MSVAMKSAATTGNSNCPVGDEFFCAFFRYAQKNYDYSDGSKISRQKNTKTHRIIV